MLSTYKERIIKELERVPGEKMPKLYKVIHQITSEFISEAKKPGKRGSLKGLWKGSSIDDSYSRSHNLIWHGDRIKRNHRAQSRLEDV